MKIENKQNSIIDIKDCELDWIVGGMSAAEGTMTTKTAIGADKVYSHDDGVIPKDPEKRSVLDL